MRAQIWNYRFWVEEVDPAILETLMQQLLVCAGFHIVGKVSKTFTPQGFTLLFLLCESHLAIHTFPEENKTYIELSSCNKKYFENFKARITESETLKIVN